jgi:hypothetical protein
MQRSRNGDTDPIRVATTGVFEFDCPSGTFELGDLVGADENTVGDGLLNQQVASVSQSQYAVARVAKRVPAAATSVLVDVRSTVMTGGVAGTSFATKGEPMSKTLPIKVHDDGSKSVVLDEVARNKLKAALEVCCQIVMGEGPNTLNGGRAKAADGELTKLLSDSKPEAPADDDAEA